jgi:hypothetical protein
MKGKVGPSPTASIKDGGYLAYLGNLLHVCNHLIISLGLFAKPREEGLGLTL